MPLGTGFENSAMKSSFSLSSLQATVTTPDKGVVKPRLYSSLTKNRVKAPSIRRSWGSTASEHREEFWMALQANYNYIMDNQLIDKCQEANNDLSPDSRPWSLELFYTQFSELYFWLNSVQEMIYGQEENIIDKDLRTRCVGMFREKNSLFTLFNDQAKQLIQLHPKDQEEINWKVMHLNSKWQSLLNIIEPSECEKDLDIDHEIKCLRNWFKMMEDSIPPLSFRVKYTKADVEKKALEFKVLHQDIENHGKIVNSVVKLCRRPDAKRVVNGLERRWHRLFLRSFEWQCFLESLSKRSSPSVSSDNTESDYDDEEPVNKYPRLNLLDSSSSDLCNLSTNKNSQESLVKSQTEDVMNKDIKNNVQTKNNIPEENIFKFREDTSQFTKSNRKAPNLGTYYFRHEDTDSDMDKVGNQSNVSKCETQSTVEETSEEEWTYTKTTDNQGDNETTTEQPKQKMIPEETIRKLVLEAEELVSPCKIERERTANKMLRVKKWLSIEKPDDSCDASGEDDERESQLSEDFDDSTTTFRATQLYNSRDTSFSETNKSECSPTVNLRQKRYVGMRPWSVSCVSHLDHSLPADTTDNIIPNYSISESEIHKLKLQKFDKNSIDSKNFTSGTIDESCSASHDKTSPNRKKRMKYKKRLSLKSDLASPNIYRRNYLMKSGSFSGTSSKNIYSDRNISSDPPTNYNNRCETSTTSGADSEEECRRLPLFKLGFKTNYLDPIVRDSSPEKNTTEELSSLSEQAWDSYQEKYLSEAYSEAHDSDAARRLLEFGEDYRNFLDSQSDRSTNPDCSPTFRRKTLKGIIFSDSENDIESLRHLLKKSRDQFNMTHNLYTQQMSLGSNKNITSQEIDILTSTCDRHIELLNNIEKSSDNFVMSKSYKEFLTDLLVQWQNLKSNVSKMQEFRNLQREIAALKNELTSVNFLGFEANSAMNIVCSDDLPKEVDFYEKKLEEIYEYKKKLLPLNVSVHRFVVENKEYNSSTLKTDVSELYRIWDSLYTNATEKLTQLKPLLQAWKTLENRLEQLQVDLRSDEKTLHLLDTALQGGNLSSETAGYIRDVAKLLSETTMIQDCKFPEILTEGGSLSDSGISDEGSEHELGERERRLAAIRRLVRQLEVVLDPECKVRVKMAEKLKIAEEELKELQKRCRSLIACTAEYSVPIRPSEEDITTATLKKDPDDDPNDDPHLTSWFRRVVRASIPFQVLIITLLCVACFLEPQCCDNMNNFARSFSPQLKYVKGPPPI